MHRLPLARNAAARCGCAQRREVLEYVPGHFKVIEHARPKVSCRCCEAIHQASPPDLPIERGRPGPGLLAHVLISKYCDHLPLYRQAEICARRCRACPLDPGRLVGAPPSSCARSSRRSAPMCSRPTSFTATTRRCRCWRLEPARPRPAGSGPMCAMTSPLPAPLRRRCSTATAPTARASTHAVISRTSEAPCERIEAACWAHVRRKFFAALYGIESQARRQRADLRCSLRLLDELEGWFEASLLKIPGESELAGAIRYALNRWVALTRYRNDGRLEIDTTSPNAPSAASPRP